MTRYLEQTQSTAIALPNCFREWGFPSALAVVSSSSPCRSPNFVTGIAVKSTISSTSTSASCSVGVRVPARCISRRIGGTTKKRRRRFRSAHW
jgi:hypothetical protein